MKIVDTESITSIGTFQHFVGRNGSIPRAVANSPSLVSIGSSASLQTSPLNKEMVRNCSQAMEINTSMESFRELRVKNNNHLQNYSCLSKKQYERNLIRPFMEVKMECKSALMDRNSVESISPVK